MKKFEFWIDENCEICKEAIGFLKEIESKKHTDFEEISKERITISADRNSAGNITHWHLEKIV